MGPLLMGEELPESRWMARGVLGAGDRLEAGVSMFRLSNPSSRQEGRRLPFDEAHDRLLARLSCWGEALRKSSPKSISVVVSASGELLLKT